jgi:glycosyltransferase involved in cell wall biosynthesis
VRSRPRVALDLRWLQQAHRNSPGGALGGIAVVTRNLWLGLAAADAVDMTALLDAGDLPPTLSRMLDDTRVRSVVRLPGSEVSEGRGSRRLFRRLLENEVPWMTDLRRLDIDILHRLDHVPPPRRAAFATVATVYDVIPFEPAGYLPPAQRLLRRCEQMMIAAQTRAAVVVAISHATARRLVEHVPALSGRVHVIPCGVLPPPAPRDASRSSAPYFLHVGTLAGRKNPAGLLQACALFRQHGSPSARLVCAGPYRSAPHAVNDIRRLGSQLGIDDAIDIVDEVDDAALADLYRGAVALVFPSFDEGFGLPLVEALAVGTPCVAADLEACREAAGPLGIYVDPGSAVSIADGMQRAADPLHRARIAERGPSWATGFSVADMAARYLAVYHAVLDNRNETAAVAHGQSH